MRKFLIGSLLGMVISGAASAEGPYVGGKLAWVDVDDELGVGFGSAINAGVVLGYEFMSEYGLAAEAEFTTTVNDGDWSYLGASDSWDVDTQALYLVSRLGQEAYAKIKAGYLNGDMSVDVLGQTIDGGGDGFSWGLGGGYKFTPSISAEVEWTQMAQDVDAWSAGVNYSF